jgi:hypothetical protein
MSQFFSKTLWEPYASVQWGLLYFINIGIYIRTYLPCINFYFLIHTSEIKYVWNIYISLNAICTEVS